MKNWFYVVALSLGVGCGTAVVRPYIGEQQAWPVASGSIVITSYDLPVFTSLPPATYNVLGELRYNCWYKALPEASDMPDLVTKGQELGADAILFVDGEVFFSTNYGPKPTADTGVSGGLVPTLTQVNRFNPDSFKPGVTILAIKWTNEPPPGLPKKKAQPATVGSKTQPAKQATAPETPATEAKAPAVETPAPTPPSPPVEAAPAPATPPAEPPPPPAVDTNATPGKIQFR